MIVLFSPFYYSGVGHVYHLLLETTLALPALLLTILGMDTQNTQVMNPFSRKSNLIPGLMMLCIAIKDLREVLRAC